VAAAASLGSLAGSIAAEPGPPPAPWFRRTRRWVQTNLNEQDPASYDALLWSDYWRRVRAQGVIVNAGGIVAFYPTRLPWHHRALSLGERDLLGEIAAAAREAGLTVLACMDSTRTYEEVYRAHPRWFARDASGQPFRSGDLYTVCVNGPWVDECVPAILREIAEGGPAAAQWSSWQGHSYLRLPASGRAAVLEGFEETDLPPFGGRLEVVRPGPSSRVVLTYVPELPQSPPENVWMREPTTSVAVRGRALAHHHRLSCRPASAAGPAAGRGRRGAVLGR